MSIVSTLFAPGFPTLEILTTKKAPIYGKYGAFLGVTPICAPHLGLEPRT